MSPAYRKQVLSSRPLMAHDLRSVHKVSERKLSTGNQAYKAPAVICISKVLAHVDPSLRTQSIQFIAFKGESVWTKRVCACVYERVHGFGNLVSTVINGSAITSLVHSAGESRLRQARPRGLWTCTVARAGCPAQGTGQCTHTHTCRHTHSHTRAHAHTD